jgi:hypothetical protein
MLGVVGVMGCAAVIFIRRAVLNQDAYNPIPGDGTLGDETIGNGPAGV